jgi:hypothetical protein
MSTGDRLPEAPSIVAANLKLTDKNTLKGVVDIAVPRWHLMLRGCLWHRKNDREWINFPLREWTDRSGTNQYAILIEFTDRETSSRFQTAALAAVHQLAGEVRPPESRATPHPRKRHVPGRQRELLVVYSRTIASTISMRTRPHRDAS